MATAQSLRSTFPASCLVWGDDCPLSIEAASDAIVTLIKRRGLASLAATDARLADFLQKAVLNELKHSQDHAASINMSGKDRFLVFLNGWLKRSGAS